MNHAERIQAVMEGRVPDRIPISFWRHFPLYDRSAPDLARRMLEWQEIYDLDFIKVMLERYGPLPDWGAKVHYYDPDPFRLGEMEEPLVKTLEDWERFSVLDARKGTLARDIEVVRLIAEDVPTDVPIVQTVFSPFTLAYKAAGQALYDHLRTEPEIVLGALNRITETIIRFVQASLGAGAWGLFYAVQGTERERISYDEHRDWAEPFDLQVLDAAAQRKGFNILHIHGTNTLFQEFKNYPIDIINWEPGDSNPSVSEALKLTPKTLLAGIHHERVVDYSQVQAAESVQDTIQATDAGRLIVGPTCTILPQVSPATLRIAERVTRDYRPQTEKV